MTGNRKNGWDKRDLEVIKYVSEQAIFPIGTTSWNKDNSQGAKLLAENELRAKSVEPNEPKSVTKFITTATPTELGCVRDYLESIEFECQYEANLIEDFGGWLCVGILPQSNSPLTICLVTAEDHGGPFHEKLLKRITSTGAEVVVCVGCMGGRKDKVDLFDVVVPRLVYNGAAVGTKNGKIVLEKMMARFTPRFSNVVASWASKIEADTGIHLEATKRTVASGNVVEDMDSELMSAMIAADPDEIVGIEMEGYAIASAHQDGWTNCNNKKITFGMVKGVADFGQATVDEPEELKKIESIAPGLVNEKKFAPRANKAIKARVQRVAITRATTVALILVANL